MRISLLLGVLHVLDPLLSYVYVRCFGRTVGVGFFLLPFP